MGLLPRSHAFEEFQHWRRGQHLTCSQKRFTRRRLSLLTKKSWPVLKGKAHNALVVCEWLVGQAEAHKVTSRNAQLMYAVVWAWHTFFNVCRAEPLILSDRALNAIRTLKPLMFDAWNELAWIHQAASIPAWKCIPNMHPMCACFVVKHVRCFSDNWKWRSVPGRSTSILHLTS